MSGRIYDSGVDPVCKKCGSSMMTSRERNFNGAKCKNTKCDGGMLDAEYTEYSANSNPVSFVINNVKK